MFNPQINWGEDILSRIFYTKDQPEHRKRLQKATAEGFCALMEQLREKTGIDTRSCPIMTVSGNTTMIHFLLGLDAFEVFQSPYAVQTLAPDICRAEELGISMNGFVYCCPGLENYLGGDIISGMLATGIPDQEEICVFLDVGTNGELVVGNKDFLLAGAGAAGPALEGGGSPHRHACGSRGGGSRHDRERQAEGPCHRGRGSEEASAAPGLRI